MMSIHAMARRLATPGPDGAQRDGGDDGHAPHEHRAAVVPAPRVGATPAPFRVERRRADRAHVPGASAPWSWRAAGVNVQPVINTVRATLSHQAALAGADPAV